MRVAILGTGKMGGAMAKRLHAAGHQLILWNRTRDRAEAVGVGTVASSPAEAVKTAEIVISMLTDADAVRSTYSGANGAAAGANDKQVFVEMTTAGPGVSVEIASVIERTGARFVEAPILGNPPMIEAGKAMVLAAGSEEAIQGALPVLEAFGEVRRIGGLGKAASLKLVANSMLMGVGALAAELQAAGVEAGLDAGDVFWVITRIAPVLAARKSGLVGHRYEPVMFALRDAVKDLKLATELYGEVRASTPLTTATKTLYERAAKSAADLDMSAISTLYE